MPACETHRTIVFIPFAGGGGRTFKTLQADIPSDIRCVDINYSGRYQGALAKSPSTVGHMVDEVMECLQNLMQSQVVLFGYSLGALVAYEVAQRYETMPSKISGLVVAACRPPHLFTCQGIRLDGEDDDFLDSISSLVDIPDYLYSNPAARKYILPTLKSDFIAASGYRYLPRPLLSTPLFAVAGTKDKFAPFAEVKAWRQYTSGRFTEHCLPGEHFFYKNQAESFSRILQYMLSV